MFRMLTKPDRVGLPNPWDGKPLGKEIRKGPGTRRLAEPTPPPILLTRTALLLPHEPAADCARYDSLRGTSRHGMHPNPGPDGKPQA